jgi:hypothetical protein
MANIIPNEGKRCLIAGSANEIDFLVDTIKTMLVGTGYTENLDHQFISDGPVANRIAGTTDQTLSSKAIGKDDTGDFAYLDAADPTWLAVASGTVGKTVTYKSTGVDGTSRIIAVHDVSVVANGGDITVQWATPANGGLAKHAQ